MGTDGVVVGDFVGQFSEAVFPAGNYRGVCFVASSFRAVASDPNSLRDANSCRCVVPSPRSDSRATRG
ncbi:hypothetical protein C8039_14065 [Halogeometricum sp. wsp3]|nr:hypothetical protein C8039_14065 [Halogeometricum sp. wsp3]